MAKESLLRAQLAFADQREIFDYWQSLAQARGGIALRADLEPGRMKRRLPLVSLIAAEQGAPGGFRVRLAGTGLRDAFGGDLTGRALADFEKTSRLAYWLQALKRVVATGEPSQGVVSLEGLGKPHLVQNWLRLPLSSNGRDVDLIIGYDRFLPAPGLSAAFAAVGAE